MEGGPDVTSFSEKEKEKKDEKNRTFLGGGPHPSSKPGIARRIILERFLENL